MTHWSLDLQDVVEAPGRCETILRAPVGQHPVVRIEGNRLTVRVRVRSTPKRVRVATREIGPDDRPKESIQQLRLRRR